MDKVQTEEQEVVRLKEIEERRNNDMLASQYRAFLAAKTVGVFNIIENKVFFYNFKEKRTIELCIL